VTSPDHESHISPEELRELSKKLDAAASPHLDKAWGLLQGARRITHSNFTAVVYTLALAYAEGVEWVEEDLKSKRTHLTKICAQLDQTARLWAETEQANTIK